MLLSIVIISYNTRELLRDCLRSVKNSARPVQKKSDFGENEMEKQSRRILEAWVVDNASSDGSAQMVEAEFPWVNLIRSKTNVGFSKANNLAIPNCRGRYILFLNSDTLLPKDFLPELIEFLDGNPDVGILSCQLVLKEGSLDPDCHRGFPTPWASFTYFSGLERLFPKSRLFGQYHAFYKPMDKIHEIDAGAGAFMMVRKSALDEVGLWDEDFFFYGEDLDLCYRFKEAGWRVIYYPHVKVIHYKGASSGIKKSSKSLTKATRQTKLKVKKASTEAMRLFYQKHYRQRYPFIIDVLTRVGIFILEKLRITRFYLR